MANDYTTTDNYNLNLYGDKTPADFRDGHNQNMRILDGAMHTVSENAKNAVKTANAAKNIADSNTEKLNSMGVTDTASGAAFLNRVGTIESHVTHDNEVLAALLTANNIDNAYRAKNALERINIAYALNLDTTGATDISPSLQLAVTSTSSYHWYFPEGVYRIDSEIILKRDTKLPWRIECSSGAYFITKSTTPFKAFFTFSETESAGGTGLMPFEGEEYFSGGTFDCNGIVDSAVRLERYHSTAQNILVYNARKVGLFGSFINNFINCTILEKNMKTEDVTGIECSYDSYVSGCKIFWCKTGIKCGGNTRIIGNNIWSGMREDQTTGVFLQRNANHVTILNNYFDTLNIAVDAKTSVNCNGHIDDNLMFYSGTAGYNDLDYIGVTIDAWSHIVTGNSYSNYKRGRTVYGTVPTYIDTSIDSNNVCNDQYEMQRMPLNPRCISAMKEEEVIIYPKTPRTNGTVYTFGWILATQTYTSEYELYNNQNQSRRFTVTPTAITWQAEGESPYGIGALSLGEAVKDSATGLKWIPLQFTSTIDATADSTGSLWCKRVHGLKIALQPINRME